MLIINYFICSLIQPISKDIAEGLTKVLSQLCHKKGIKFLLTASGTGDISTSLSISISMVRLSTFSSPEAALLLVNTENRDLWIGPVRFRF